MLGQLRFVNSKAGFFFLAQYHYHEVACKAAHIYTMLKWPKKVKF